ncbi:MAG: HPF/RaiA family ribosome-associated protein [Myxococcales bacterium]|nr:HPF/RaiA family ribosome-associated protein [Myxococcales bacterium]
MQVPLQIRFRHVERSEALENYVRAHAEKLETFSDSIVRCSVALEAPHLHARSGSHYRVRIDTTVPGGEVVVSHVPGDEPGNEDLYAAIDQAFDRMGRRLEDAVRRQRGDVKPHATEWRAGRVTKLAAQMGYGFVTTPEGDEIYFHRNSVLHGAFDELSVGARVRFVEEDGDKGPQASSVMLES